MCARQEGRKKDKQAGQKLKRRESDRRFIEQMNELCGLVGMLSGDDKGSGKHV